MESKPYDPVSALRALIARSEQVAPEFREAMKPDVDLCEHDEPSDTCDRCQNQREYEAGLRLCRNEDEERRYVTRNSRSHAFGGM